MSTCFVDDVSPIVLRTPKTVQQYLYLETQQHRKENIMLLHQLYLISFQPSKFANYSLKMVGDKLLGEISKAEWLDS